MASESFLFGTTCAHPKSPLRAEILAAAADNARRLGAAHDGRPPGVATSRGGLACRHARTPCVAPAQA